MEFLPFTLDEATDVCDDFEDLKDTEFKMGASRLFLVNDVAICPFNTDDKQKFIDIYLEAKDSHKALSSYTGSDYDVILFTSDINDESDYAFIDIRAFAMEKGINYLFPGINVD